MRIVACLLALVCLAAPAAALAEVAPSPIEGSHLQCNAGQSTCSLAAAGQASTQPTLSSKAPDAVDKVLIIPLQQTPSGWRPKVQADGQPFRLVCEPRVEGQVQRCSAQPRAAPIGQPI